MDSNSSHSKPGRVQSLHLAFNQVSGPVNHVSNQLTLSDHDPGHPAGPLTHASDAQGIKRRYSRHFGPSDSNNVQTLAEACIRCARHSYTTIVESWIEGSFKTYDYFNTQYLFSAATILAISSLVGGFESVKDREHFDFAGQLLEELRDSGSFAATEFCRHIEAMKVEIEGFSSGVHMPWENVIDPGLTSASGEPCQPGMTSQAAQFMTSGMAVAEPELEAFLQSEQSSSQMDFFLDDAQLQGLCWPTYDSL